MASNFGFHAYGGTDKKVFISYKKADEARVSEIARELHLMGLNVWYDEDGGEGLQLGKKWEESISENMALSSAIVAFISKSFFKTQGYMRTEFSMANSDKKHRRLFVVFLDDISFSDVDIADRSLWADIVSYQSIEAADKTANQVAAQLRAPILQLFDSDTRDLNELRRTIAQQRSNRSNQEYTPSTAAVSYSAPASSAHAVPAPAPDPQKSWFEQNKSALSIAAIAVIAVLVLALIIPGLRSGSSGESSTQQNYSQNNYQSSSQNNIETTPPESNSGFYSEPGLSGEPRYSVGDRLTFGSFNQDNYTGNGKEGIEWMVIDADNEKALILSVKTLDIRSFHNNRKNGDTWSSSDLRSWMNGTFYDSAFDSSEKQSILSTTVYSSSNPDYGTSSGSNTTDKVFLLSADEAQMYLTQSQRKAIPTQYIKDKGGWTTDTCWWWLRTSGENHTKAVYVDEFGNIGTKGNYITDDICIRPAMYIDNH